MRYLVSIAAFCQLLLDFIKQIRNAVRNKHRADMGANQLFYQGE